jgi:hypothetical protein
MGDLLIQGIKKQWLAGADDLGGQTWTQRGGRFIKVMSFTVDQVGESDEIRLRIKKGDIN